LNTREQAVENLGGKCVKCESVKHLQLHHISYAKDSVSWWESGEYLKRAKEALEHPERFELLCKNCHNKQHENDPATESFVKMSTEAKLALKKSYRDWKKSGTKCRRLTKYEVEEFDAIMKKKHPEWSFERFGKRKRN